MTRSRTRAAAVVAGTLLIVTLTASVQAPAAPEGSDQPLTAIAGAVTAQPTLAKDYTPAAQLPPEQLARMRAKLDASRDAMAAKVKPTPGPVDPAVEAARRRPPLGDRIST